MESVIGEMGSHQTTQRRVALIQSSYIPWKGYFDVIHDVERFIFYDDVQHTHQDWRTRNRIKTSNGPLWLTIPAGGASGRLICEVPLPPRGWERKHLASITQAYAKAPYLGRYRPLLEAIYRDHRCENLSEFNQMVIRMLATECLGIDVEFRDSREFCAGGAKLDRLIDVLKKAGATHYVSGPSARGYIDEERFAQAGIALEYKDYSGYPEYPQPHPPFAHHVTLLDLLLCTGPDAPWYIWGWRSNPTPG